MLDVYSDAASRGWVIPAFGVENLTTIEAVLAATRDYGERIGVPNLPITVALTNLYAHRSQTARYTHTKRWDIGLKLFMADLRVLTDRDSPFASVNVMVHLDHIQHDLDQPLLKWDLKQFSSIMYDASTLPFDLNIRATREFVERHWGEILIEGACDEIVDAEGQEVSVLTTPEKAHEYTGSTGVDLIVANLGTEHRASAKDLRYHGELAAQIKERVGPMMVLHGTSSVPADQVRNLFDDGIVKVNIWTALERDSSPALLEDMVANAAKVAGQQTAGRLLGAGLIGPKADSASKASLDYFTTSYRQGIVFEEMKRIVRECLELWYV